jgi:ribosomal 30S subunit maturation factor RimM
MPKFQPGSWDGEYIDAHGVRGTLRLRFEGNDERVKGTYEVRFRTEDQPQVIKGDLEGETREGRLRFLLPIGERTDARGDAREKVGFDAQVSDAGSHAKQAIFGVVSGAPRANLGGGVFIAWRFDKQDR